MFFFGYKVHFSAANKWLLYMGVVCTVLWRADEAWQPSTQGNQEPLWLKTGLEDSQVSAR